MSQYKQTSAQRDFIKRMYAEKAEAEKDIHTWDTPYDERISLAEAQKRVQSERRRFELGRYSEGHTENDKSSKEDSKEDN